MRWGRERDEGGRTGRRKYHLVEVVGVLSLLVLSGTATALPPNESPAGAARAPLNGDPASAPPIVRAPALCPWNGCAGAPARLTAHGPPEALGSTATNWYVANWSGEGMIRENPSDPNNLVSGGLYQAPSAANDTTTYFGSGVSGAFTSFDGGRTWRDQTLPSSPDWSNPNSAECGHIHLADTAIGFGPNDVVYYIDLSYPAGSGTTCLNPTAGVGLYSTVSHDGGSSWGTPVPIRGTTAGTSVDKPWIAIDPSTGEAYVAYTDDVNGTGIWIQNSTDEGGNWSAPLELTSNGRTGLGVELVVDPFGGVDATWIDEGAGGIEFVRSTDHGSTFTSPIVLATPATTYSSSSPDSFRSYTLPGFAVDGYSGNAYTGTLFSVWQDGLGGTAGSPTVDLSRSTDNGSTWSTPISVSSKVTDQDYQPSVAVGPDGAVYVDWYGVNSVTGSYRLEAALSTDGGRSFAPEVTVSDVDSNPSTASTGSDWWIGDYTDITADRTGARPLWTDARSTQGWYCTGTCLWGYVYNISFYTALLVNDSLSATVPVDVAVNGTVGGTGSVSVGPSPTPMLWLVGATYNLSAPGSVTWNGSTYFFDYWYGSAAGAWLFSNLSSLAGPVAGGDHVVACYSPQPSGTCSSPGAPGFLRASATPSYASLTIDGVRQGPGQQNVPLPEPPGPHWVNASAAGYFSSNLSVLVSPGNVTWANLTLRPVAGTIAGTVSPTSASVTVDGAAIPVGTDGSFSVARLPGVHSVGASASRYYGYTNGSVVVTSSNTTFLAIVLAGLPGWINGSVAPASLSTVTINGGPLAVDPASGAFSTRVAPGTYWLNASASGYLSATSGPLSLGPLGAIMVPLSLVEILGSLSGLSVPANASVTVNGTPVTNSAGLFSATLPPGSYPVDASAWGFAPLHLIVPVRFGETTVLILTLNASAGWITGVVSPADATLEADGQPVALDTSGRFNVTEPANPHHLVVSAAGYVTLERSVTVQPGRASVVTLELTGATPSSEGLPLFVALVGVVFVALAGIAVVFVVRRRRRPRRP